MEIKRIITTTVLILALITISQATAAALPCDCGDICVNTTGWWNDGGAFNASITPIQTAVNAAGSGDTICVAAGSYTENVDIATPHITLEGAGADVVTVTAANSDDHVFYVTADYVNISGFKATGATIDPPNLAAGIRLYCANHCNISKNNCSNNSYGIVLSSSSSNLIYNNYLNNTNNAYDDGNNKWNITKTAGTNIIGRPFHGGNYWSDYTGVDNTGDCLGDTLLPYNSSGGITNGGDYHPLVPYADTTPPVITITTPVPYGLYIVGMTLDFSATDDESGVATISGNLTNTSEVSQNVDSGFAPAVGVYTLVVTATDNTGNTNVSDPVFFVVYDPDGGHATGGGWFYPDSESTLPGGKANFGFTARYKDNSSTGKLNFQYRDADIHLKSTSIDWLTISSVSAQFQGTGTINGEGLYTFRVQAKDNGEPGADTDHFDIKIWYGTDTEADPYHKAKNTISGGNIEVHTN